MTSERLYKWENNSSPIRHNSYAFNKVKKTVRLPVILRIQIVKTQNLQKYLVGQISLGDIVD